MKYILLLVLVLPVAAFAQADQSFANTLPSSSYFFTEAATVSPVVVGQNVKGNYRVALPPGYRMRKAGQIMAIGGGALLITGIVLMRTAEESSIYTYRYVNGYEVEDFHPQYAFGVLSTLGGLGLSIPGVILWRKGAHKYNRYLAQQREMPTTRVQFNNRGLSLSYRF